MANPIRETIDALHQSVQSRDKKDENGIDYQNQKRINLERANGEFNRAREGGERHILEGNFKIEHIEIVHGKFACNGVDYHT